MRNEKRERERSQRTRLKILYGGRKYEESEENVKVTDSSHESLKTRHLVIGLKLEADEAQGEEEEGVRGG